MAAYLVTCPDCGAGATRHERREATALAALHNSTQHRGRPVAGIRSSER